MKGVSSLGSYFNSLSSSLSTCYKKKYKNIPIGTRNSGGGANPCRGVGGVLPLKKRGEK